MFGAVKRGRFRSLASLILVVNVVGKLQQKRTRAASRGFLAAARLSCFSIVLATSMNYHGLYGSNVSIRPMISVILDLASGAALGAT